MLSDLELRRKYTAQITRFSTIDAESSLYHGREYRPLADFLSSHNGQGKEREFPFAWLYQFQDGSAEKPRVFASPVAFSSILQDSHIGGRILFLRGYPSAEWIAQIGSQLNIDPDMWRRHLSYLGTSRSTNDFSQPQSFSSQNIFRLCISSAGTRGVLKHPPSRKDLNEDRADAANKMAEYQASLQHNCLKKDDWRLGDSIVRSYNIHDEDLFSVEQYVTVHLIEYDPTSNNWLLIISLDFGKDLGESPTGPWRDSFHDYYNQPNFFPVDLPASKVALQPYLWDERGEPNSSINSQERLPQSVSRLHLRYGRLLNSRVMQQDPFYALNELFSFFVASEAQFLQIVSTNPLLTSLSLQDTPSNKQQDRMYEQLIYSQRLLEEHIQRLLDVLDFVRRRGSSCWPKPAKEELKVADNAATLLEDDVERLARRAEGLRARIERALAMAMNIAGINEAKRGIKQTESMFKLTVVAAFYAPFSFVTSFFGMNFQQLGTGSLNLWVFFVALMPLLLITSSFLFVDWRKIFA